MIIQAQIMMNPEWNNSVNNHTGIQMSADQLESNLMILTMVGISPNETNDFIHFYKERLTENIIQNHEKRHELITKNGTNKKPFNTNAVKIGNFLINDALQSAGLAMYQTDDLQNSFIFPYNESNQFDDNEQPNDSDDQSNVPDDEEGDQKQFFKNLANQHNLHENKTNNEHFIKQYENHPKKLSNKENTRENNANSYNTLHNYCHSTCNNCIQQNHKKICKCCVWNQ